MGCATYNYTDAVFRAQFPNFANTTTFPVALIQNYWAQAGTIVSNTTYGFLANQGGPQALYLLTAHLTQIGVQIAAGNMPQVVTGAGIDKISLTLMPPKLLNQFQWWLQTTPYGMQLLALLQTASVGGFYTPGGLGRAGFSANGLRR